MSVNGRAGIALGIAALIALSFTVVLISDDDPGGASERTPRALPASPSERVEGAPVDPAAPTLPTPTSTSVGCPRLPERAPEARPVTARAVEQATPQRVFSGRVLGGPARTPLEGVDLYVAWLEPGEGLSWLGGSDPVARSDASGEFTLSVDATSKQLLLHARKPAWRPFLQRVVVTPESRLELVLESGPAPALVGRVVDEAGAPVAGLALEVDVPFGGAPSGELLGAPARPGVIAALYQPVTVAITTGVDGRFGLDGLLAGKVMIRVVDLQAHHARPLQAEVAVEPREALLVVRRCASLEVQTLDAAGAPTAGAAVVVRPTDIDRNVDWLLQTVQVERPDGAVLLLPAGRYRVAVAFASAGSPDAGARAEVTPEHTEAVDLQWGQTRRVVVRRSGTANGVIRARLVDRSTKAPAPGQEVWLVRDDQPDWRPHLALTSEADGSVAFVDLPPGVYRVSTREEAHNSPATTIALEARGPLVEVTLEVDVPRRLQGVVRDAAGRPVPTAVVYISEHRSGSGLMSQAEVGPDGRFEFNGPSIVSVSVEADGFEELWLEDVPNDGRLIELTLTSSSSPTFFVRGRAVPAPPDGTVVEVSMYEADERGPIMSGEAPVEAGRFEVRFKSLPRVKSQGLAVVRVGSSIAQTFLFAVNQQVLDVGELTLDAGFTVTGLVEDPSGFLAADGYAIVKAKHAEAPDDDSAFEYRGDLERGRFTVHGLPGRPMRLEVLVASPGQDDRRWAKARVRFDPRTQPDLGTITLEVGDSSRF